MELERKRQDKRRRVYGHVYFIADDLTVKIGFSTHVASRFRRLQAEHDRPLTVLGAFPGTMIDESLLHIHFHRLRLEGEWFLLSPSITGFIKLMEDARDHFGPWAVTISDILNGTMGKGRNMENKTPRSLGAYLEWYERKKGTFGSVEIEKRARFCELHLRFLNRNPELLDTPNRLGEKMLRDAAADFAKLEALLSAHQ